MGIRIGIVGYGNLGKGVELAIQENSDMELAAIFTRRNPASIADKIRTKGAPVVAFEKEIGRAHV